MTKFVTSVKLFSIAFFAFSCAPKNLAQKTTINHKTSDSGYILGGTKVLPTSKFSSRVLFLSLGVKIEKSSKGVSLTQKSQCTGFAISPKIILTAAHCVKDMKAEEIYVVLGNAPMKSALDLTKWHEAEKVISHKDYDQDAKLFDIKAPIYDIAVIKLKNSLDKKHVSEIAENKNLPANLTLKQELTLAGYGLRTNDDKKVDDDQYIGELYSITKKAEPFTPLDPTILLDQYDATGICSGDSGSGAFVYDPETKEHYVVGILSGYTWEGDKPHAKCVGTARYTSIITPEMNKWLTQTIGGM